MWRILLLALAVAAATPATARDARLLRPAGEPAPAPAPLSLALAQGDAVPAADAAGPSPFLAGLASAAVPGAGQLIQGQNRGWFYLGVELAAWFAALSLKGAGDQAISDARSFADDHWDTDRYLTVTDCGEGLGPSDFEAEAEILLDNEENNRDAFYDDIGSQPVYACGWDMQTNRSVYNDMRSDADGLYNGRDLAVGVIVLNHIVSAIDAAKSASNRRRAQDGALDLRVTPAQQGLLAFQVRMHRTF